MRSGVGLLFATIVVLAACTAAGPAGPTSSGSVPGAIAVNLTDSLRMEPDAFTVKAGVPITFSVTNKGTMNHDFYLGDAAAQDNHAAEMAAMGGMSHDEPGSIALKPGETKSVTHTFSGPGEFLAGCHVAGHYGAGMKAVITVTN